MNHRILITGAAGFIGSAVVRYIIQNTEDSVCVVDKLTYAGNLESLEPVSKNPRYRFEKVDVCDPVNIERVFTSFQPTHIMHLAAETHVDRSIDGPREFIQTNIVGTYTLLEAARKYVQTHPELCFHHISTDEVYGDLEDTNDFFREDTPYAPSSPYSASKASSDHLVRAWKRTFGLSTVITNCSNNYGPYQFPEKLIPLMINNCLKDKDLPVYGDGMQVRDWLHVSDHCSAIDTVLHKGVDGEVYNIGGNNEKANIEIVKLIISTLGKSEDLIKYVKDRPGHDRRYAIDNTKITTQLGWKPTYTFEQGMKETIEWYLNNTEWIENVISGDYMKYYNKMYTELK